VQIDMNRYLSMRLTAPNADFANQWVLLTGGLTKALERDIRW
jgi:hypothetical protein